MISTPNRTGRDPFAALSTFRSGSVVIPRGMFYGGRMYFDFEYALPCHISYIAGPDSDTFGTWGVVDANGQEVGAVIFSEGSSVGTILSITGKYAGCIKGIKHPANMSGTSGGTYDLQVYLSGITGETALDPDTLVFDIDVCSRISSTGTEDGYTDITFPSDSLFCTDANGKHYLAGSSSEPLTVLRELTISGGSGSIVTLGGTGINHVAITKGEGARQIPTDNPDQYGYRSGYTEIYGDIHVQNVNGAIVIADGKSMMEETV